MNNIRSAVEKIVLKRSYMCNYMRSGKLLCIFFEIWVNLIN